MTKWLIFFFLAGSICSLLCGIADRSYFGPGTGTTLWNPFFDAITAVSKGNLLTVGSIIFGDLPHVFTQIINMLTWNYGILQGGAGLVLRVVLLLPLSAAFIITLVMQTASLVTGGGGGEV